MILSVGGGSFPFEGPVIRVDGVQNDRESTLTNSGFVSWIVTIKM